MQHILSPRYEEFEAPPPRPQTSGVGLCLQDALESSRRVLHRNKIRVFAKGVNEYSPESPLPPASRRSKIGNQVSPARKDNFSSSRRRSNDLQRLQSPVRKTEFLMNRNPSPKTSGGSGENQDDVVGPLRGCPSLIALSPRDLSLMNRDFNHCSQSRIFGHAVPEDFRISRSPHGRAHGVGRAIASKGKEGTHGLIQHPDAAPVKVSVHNSKDKSILPTGAWSPTSPIFSVETLVPARSSNKLNPRTEVMSQLRESWCSSSRSRFSMAESPPRHMVSQRVPTGYRVARRGGADSGIYSHREFCPPHRCQHQRPWR